MKRYCVRERDQLFLNVVKEGASAFILMLNLDRKIGLLVPLAVRNLPRPCLCYHFTLSSWQHCDVGIYFRFMVEETEAQSYKTNPGL